MDPWYAACIRGGMRGALEWLLVLAITARLVGGRVARLAEQCLRRRRSRTC